MRVPAWLIALPAAALVAGACRSPRTRPAIADTVALPGLGVYEISARTDSAAPALTRSSTRDPLAGVSSTRRVTLTAVNQDVRLLLLWLAEQAGVGMVIAPDVNARVTVAFRDTPVVEALRAVMVEAGLSVLVGPLEAPWPPVVFYQLPVNVNVASAEAIAARFGVSLELARFITESRPLSRP